MCGLEFKMWEKHQLTPHKIIKNQWNNQLNPVVIIQLVKIDLFEAQL